jgi:imidazolonepropionase-like amidohydrolase
MPLLALLALAGCGGTDGPATFAGGSGAVQAYTNANIFDGTGGQPIQNGVLLVQDGRVTQVGSASQVQIPAGAEVTDLAGRWVIPGLINAHAHVDDPTGDRTPEEEQLDIYAHYGVTTVLSLGEASPDALALRGDRWTPQLGTARLIASGPIRTPMTVDSARILVEELAAMDVDWVKIRVDDFLGTQTKMPPEVYQAVISEANSRNLPVAVHMVTLDDAKGVLRAGASLIAHSVRDRAIDQEFIDLLNERNVCVVPTFTRELSTYVYAERPPFFDDPFFRERASPPDPDVIRTPEFQASQRSAAADYYREQLPVAKENMVRLKESGVGIAFGTDTGVTFAGRYQGYLEHVELEMMVEAGFTPAEALQAATGVTARCIGLAGQVGTLQTGAWADFVVLDANPLEDIRNTREMHGVWIAGNRIR